MVMYGPNDPSDENRKSDKNDGSPHPDVTGVWSALATTESWISKTLSNSGPDNPYKRKEVSYVCETSTDSTFIVAGLFRRVKEAREMGEIHGQQQQRYPPETSNKDEQHRPHTLRQTQVIVIPWSETFNHYPYFQAIIEAINRARRNARDLYVATDDALQDWTVSINAAGLHPQFGQKTPDQILKDMKNEEQQPDIDVNLSEYIERKNKARQSPYPSVVVEVRATPNIFTNIPNTPPAPSKNTDNSHTSKGSNSDNSIQDPSPSREDLQRLEALFAMSAATKPDTPAVEQQPSEEQDRDEIVDFYDAIGKAFGNQEVSMETPENLARYWVQENHDDYVDDSTSTFMSCDTKYVDAAYEFVFYNIAMHLHSSTTVNKNRNSIENVEPHLSYLIMPNFVPTSATSFEKFAIEVQNIISIIPGLSNHVSSVSTLHPEHIDSNNRSNVPIFILEWNDH